jgi:hypothetical protein
MVQKYAHLSSEHLAQWVDRRPAVLAENLPKSGTFLTTGKEKGARLLAKPLDCLVGTNGLEPSTPWMSTKCSNQLSYAPIAGFALYPKAYRASNENRAQF